MFLNQMRVGQRQACTWFLEITFTARVYACVCVCVRVRVCVRPRGHKKLVA